MLPAAPVGAVQCRAAGAHQHVSEGLTLDGMLDETGEFRRLQLLSCTPGKPW